MFVHTQMMKSSVQYITKSRWRLFRGPLSACLKITDPCRMPPSIKAASTLAVRMQPEGAPPMRSLPQATPGAVEPVVQIPYQELRDLTPSAVEKLHKAFVGERAYGAVAITGIPNYAELKHDAFRAGVDLALLDDEGRKRSAAVNNTYPGWSGTPGSETHPLQNSFLFNVKEELGGQMDPFFGKNIFPSEDYRKTWVKFVDVMYANALQVLRGCDKVLDTEIQQWQAQRSLERLGDDGPALAGRFICYDSGFTREDKLLELRDGVSPLNSNASSIAELPQSSHVHEEPSEMSVKTVGHAGDGLASMRTHATPVKTAGHAGDGLASMRTHATPVKTAGHAGDGLASMRTHATPVKTAGHAGDGLASMRTHATPVKTAGHAGDGLASMRTHATPVKTAGHAGDGLASMRTHATPVKTAGHAGNGLASMRTHATPVKTAGHAGDGLASMRTHATPVKTAGHAGDGLASMRTHATPVKTAGHAGDGLASMRTHATPVKTAGHAGDGMATMQTPSAPVKTSSSGYNPLELSSSLAGSLSSQGSDDAVPVSQPETDYWLPWHVDSNFVTILHKEMYASESTGEFISEPPGSGLMFMNEVGETTMLDCSDPNTMLLQMGAFAQIYTGGKLKACRHAVLNPVKPGVARFNYCNFWYVPWDTLCTAPEGMEATAVNQGWNAMMDESYLNITMKQSFTAFRQFMVSPEARVQFSDSQRFKELSAILPIVRKQGDAGAPTMPNIQVDLLTDVRCPFSFISQMNLQNAIQNLGLQDNVVVRYHPVFLNPNVPKEGESLDDYLWREFGYTKEYAHSEDYPLRRYGREAGVEMNPHRRVVNTFDAFCLIEAAQEEGVQHELVQTLSRWYFEEAKDISDVAVLRAAALHVGLDAERALQRSSELQGTVQERYEEFSAMLGEVPHFLLREQASGNGLELGGLRSVEAWEQVLQQVMERGQFMGMTIDGPHGQKVRVDRANPFTPVSHALPAQHGWTPTAWSYQEEDFSRMDERPDDLMYSEPRLAEHLDLSSLQTLTETYEAIFQACPDGFSVLDLCSSWNSHYPNMDRASKVAVHGLNAVELEMNEVATERHIQDLNLDQKLPWADNSFDVATLALSIQYLTKPREVFAELQRVLKPGGMAVVAFSHRSFIEKAVRLWASEPDDGEGHAHVVCRYFQHGPENGWEKIKTMDVSPRHGDPVWIVTAVKPM
ncbi:unnamed protein product [Durusdinium trenchii]|uniref:Methyltransferase type 11 domain-containing protein n=1 Tax=Durusdinium trenchii TaxID=1381693 RepID=A0ABP0R6I1_9DINO